MIYKANAWIDKENGIIRCASMLCNDCDAKNDCVPVYVIDEPLKIFSEEIILLTEDKRTN